MLSRLLASPDCSGNMNILRVSRYLYWNGKQENELPINPEPFAQKKTPN